MRQRTDTFEELQFSSQIPWRLGFLREASMFAEAFSRALPLVFGPVIIEMWVDGEWAEASMGWGGVCSAYAVGLNLGGCFGRSMLRRRMRMSALQTPLLDSNLVRVARTVNGEAGAAFLVLGLVGLALSTLAIGLCRSVPLLAIARGLSGFCAGAIVGRWDPAIMDRSSSSSRPRTRSDSQDDSAGQAALFRDATGAPLPRACAQANSSMWLTGFTFGPLLGILFQQRAFSRLKELKLKIPSLKTVELTLKRRQLFPALAPCAGGAAVLVLLALLVMCETGVRWLKYMRCRCLCCRRCDKYCCCDAVDGGAASESLLAGSVDDKAALLIPEQLSGYSDYGESEYGSDDDDMVGALHGSSRLDRFLTADGDFSDDEEAGHAAGWAERDRLETEELNCVSDSPDKSIASADSDKSTEEGIAYMWPDFVASFGEAKAKAKFETMIAFRKVNGIDQILETPHPKFYVFKEAYPFVIHGRTKLGELVSYECPGKMNMSKASAEGVTAEALSGILSAQYEFISLLDLEKQQAVAGNMLGDADFKQSPARCMSIVDMGGISFRAVNKDTFSFLITAGGIMDNYYPKRVARIFLVNVPGWFSGVWSGLSTMLPKSVVDNVRICGQAETTKLLLQFISIEELPLEYIDGATLQAFRAEEAAASKSPHQFLKFGEHPYEKRLCAVVSKALKRDADEKSSRVKAPLLPSQHRSEASALHALGSKVDTDKAMMARSQSDKPPRPPSPAPTVAARPPPAPLVVELPPQTGMRRVSSTPDFVTAVPVGKDTEANSSGHHGGLLVRSDSWLSRFVWPRSKSAHSSASNKQMHLGEENKFQYDSLKGEWVLQQVTTVGSGGGDDGSGNGSPKTALTATAALTGSGSSEKPHGLMTSESAVQLDGKLLEEHAIALAIQAAHLAAEWQRVGHHPGSHAQGVEQAQGHHLAMPHGHHSKLHPLSHHGRHGPHTAAHATNFKLLVVLVVFHAAMGFVHVGLETVVPLWAFSPTNRGGLGFEPVDAALVLAFVGCALLLQRNLVPRRLAAIPYHAPLRSLRVSVGILFVLCVAAAWVPHPELHSKHRNETALVWVAVTVLLGGLANAVILGRSATTVMLQVAFKSHPLKPGHKKFIEQTLAVSEAGAPLLSAVAFAWTYTLDAPYPLDCTSCFNAVAALACMLYTASLVLHAHIGGEAKGSNGGQSASGGAHSGCFRAGSPSSCCCSAAGLSRHCPSCIALPASDVSALLGDASLVTHSRLGVRASAAHHGGAHSGLAGGGGSSEGADIPSSLASLSARKTLSMKRV